MKKIMWSLLIAAFLSSCAPGTQITGSWKNPNTNAATLNKILITALTSNTQARQTIENDLSAALEQNGYQPVKSMEILPPKFTAGKEPDKEVLLDKIKGTAVDAILTIAVLNKETENRYVAGNYGYAPIPRFGYYGRFWGYYSNWYPTIYADGYYAEDKVYFLETNLYDAETEELIWSGQSETYTPGDLSSFSREFAAVVMAKMEADGIIAKRVISDLN
jgi:hypothetical protein